MGAGDWIMASAQAREAFKLNGKKCVFQNPDKLETYWHEVFEGNPHIEQFPKEGMLLNVIPNYIGHRPYFHGLKGGKVHWNDEHRAVPGDLYLRKEELSAVNIQTPYVVVEPNVHQAYGYAVNKDWGFKNWQQLIYQNRDIQWVQPVYKGAKKLDGVRYFDSPSFRTGCALVAKSLFLVATDGGLHHAAAALGKPAVVIWGGFVSPKILGYDTHINISDGGEPCGTQKFCGHCARVMKSITVERVAEEVSSLYSQMSKDGTLSSKPSPAVVEGAQLVSASGTEKASR